MFRDFLARDPRVSFPQCIQTTQPRLYEATCVTHLQRDGLRVGTREAIAHGGEPIFEFGDFFRDESTVPVAQAAKLVRDVAFEFGFVTPQFHVVLAPRGERIRQLLLEALERVGDDVRMPGAILQATEELPLQVQPADQEIVRADGVAALRVHRATVAGIRALPAPAGDDRDAPAALGAEEQPSEQVRRSNRAATPLPSSAQIVCGSRGDRSPRLTQNRKGGGYQLRR